MKTLKFKVVLLPILTVMIGHYAMAYQLVCPTFVETITTKPELVNTPKNWEAITPESRVWVDSATITLGPIEKLGFLKPENYKFNKKIYDWKLSKKDFETYGVWFSCSYNNNQVVLTQKISEPMSACRVITTNETNEKLMSKKIMLECE